MARHQPSQNGDRLDWDYGVAVGTSYDTDQFLTVQVDAFGEEESGAAPAEQAHWFGRSARPLDPENGAGASVLYAYQGEQHFAWLANDPRVQPKIPALQKGGQALYDSNGSYWLFNPDDKTVRLIVPGDSGQSKLEVSNGVLTWQSPGGTGKIVSQDSGTAVTGQFTTDQITKLGGSSAVPLSKYQELLQVLQQVQQALIAINGATGSPPLTPISGALAPFISALSAAMSSFSATGATTNTTAA